VIFKIVVSLTLNLLRFGPDVTEWPASAETSLKIFTSGDRGDYSAM